MNDHDTDDIVVTLARWVAQRECGGGCAVNSGDVAAALAKIVALRARLAKAVCVADTAITSALDTQTRTVVAERERDADRIRAADAHALVASMDAEIQAIRNVLGHKCTGHRGLADVLRARLAEADVETEELREALQTLLGLTDHLLHADNIIDERAEEARDLLRHPPTLGALRAREALAALAWTDARSAWDLCAGPGAHSEWQRLETAACAYRDAHAAREAAEKEKTR